MTFDEWWESDGRFYDPDWSDVDWYDKRKSLAEYAWHRAIGPQLNKNENCIELSEQ